MSEPVADSKPHAAFVFNYEGEQYVMRKDYERLREMLSWIPVSERLPPIVHRPGQSSDDVFIALQYPDGEHLLTIGYYSHSDQIWHSRTAKHGWQPTHWMPLPEPPESKR